MPVIETTKDLFDTSLEANVLVNPVNCVGRMGKGLAKQFATKYPQILQPYKEACSKYQLEPGLAYILDLKSMELKSDHIDQIILFTTKGHWKNGSRLCWIETGLDMLCCRCQDFFSKDDIIAIPKVGAGLGGLNEKDVIQMIHYKLDDVEQKVWLCV